MPTREEKWPAGTPCWVDLAAPDVAAGTAFYGPVLGWTFQDTGEPFDHYHLALSGDRVAAAIGKIQRDGQPSAWTVYLASDDVDDTAKLISDNGGSVLVEPVDIPEVGRTCVAQDPTGAAFGVWQADPVIGIGVYNQPGSLCWEDAGLADAALGKRFYAEVFGYRYTPVEGAPAGYETFGVDGGDPLGGIGGVDHLPAGTPSHWLPYFSVADVDAAAAAAQAGGGSAVMAGEDTPFGRIAVVRDPFGGAFGLHAEIAG
ncbi:MAG: VOC family protein [Pseudonocardia sp.]